MIKYKGIIFDLDGTLLNTLEDIADCMNEVLSAYGCCHRSNEEYKVLIGKGIRNLITRSFPEDFNINDIIDDAFSMYISIYNLNYNRKTQPYPGISEMLEMLYSNNIKMGVNSNKRNDFTVTLIKEHFPGIEFTGIYGECEDIPKKPDPTAALKISSLMQLPVEAVLYIGDSKTDMETGENANMSTAGVTWGYRDVNELISHNADYIFNKPEEITDFFIDCCVY